MERFRCQSRCPGQRVTLDQLVHREFLAETAETANKGQPAPQGHKVLLVLLVQLVHRAPRERKAHREFPAKTACLARRETLVHRAFLALQDETAEKAHKVRKVPKARKAKKATLEAHLPTSCLST